MLVSEKEMLSHLKKAKNVLLIEPRRNKDYPPLGLMKISSYIKSHGGKVVPLDYFIAGKWDLICVTTLFTYESEQVFECLDCIKTFAPKTPVLIGGIFASILPKEFLKRYPKMMLFTGYSKILDEIIPDYTLQWGNKEKWDDYCFVFTQRGCVNNCPYCAVKQIEPEKWENPKWKNGFISDKPNIAISDNHLLSCNPKHIINVFSLVKKQNKKVLFNNGLDCKYVTDENAKWLSELKYAGKGLRLAFDRIDEDGVFQKAIETLVKAGCTRNSIEIYCMYNFNDTPQEADYRCAECLRLKIQQYPIPYRPLNRLKKTPAYIGKYWTENLVRAFREFWLFGSNYRSTIFDKYLYLPKTIKKFKLGEEDFQAWRFKK